MEQVIQAPNFVALLKKEHLNKWVAFSTDYKKLLAVGEDLSDLLRKTGKKEVAVMQVSDKGYAGFVSLTKWL